MDDSWSSNHSDCWIGRTSDPGCNNGHVYIMRWSVAVSIVVTELEGFDLIDSAVEVMHASCSALFQHESAWALSSCLLFCSFLCTLSFQPLSEGLLTLLSAVQAKATLLFHSLHLFYLLVFEVLFLFLLEPIFKGLCWVTKVPPAAHPFHFLGFLTSSFLLQLLSLPHKPQSEG